jgi:putative NADH-flavin reductase
MNEQITVFGANGKVGSLIVADLLARGYSVVAFVHRTHHLPVHDKLTIHSGDVYQPDEVSTAIAGSTTVVSALGSWGTPKKDILTVGMRHIIAGMHEHGVTRIVSLTGADARAPGDKLSLIHRLSHFGIGVLAGKVLADGERHIQLLAQSDLDWTVVRSPIMGRRTLHGRQYHLSTRRPLPWRIIPRRLVVAAMVDLVVRSDWRRQAPFLAP